MKIFMLMSTAMVSFLLIGQSHADIIPESTADIRACQAWAETHKGTVNYVPASMRCEALAACMRNNSSSENKLRECLFAVETEFHRQMSGEHTQAAEVPSRPVSPIVTEVSDSAYEDRAGKGFPGADGGDQE